MTENTPATFPAIRAWMGDWVYYVTTMTFWDVKQRVVREVTEIHKNKGLSDMIQRVLEKRSKDITRYLQTENQRFFSSIIAGIYQGKPQWNTIKITQEGDRLPLDKRTIESVGVLELSGKERIFAVDGQHRVAAIKDLITDEYHVNAGEEICVIFVAHSEDHRERTRRLFTTLNKHAKPVKAGEKVALDEDDAFAIITRRLVEDYEPLSKERVFYGKTPPIPKNNRKAVTTILTLFKITEIIKTPTKKTRAISQELKMMKNFRPSDEVLENIYLEQCEFWDALRGYIPSMKEATDEEPEKEIVAKYRTNDGGNLLFRPAGQIAFASATRVILDTEKEKKETMDSAVKKLSKIPLTLNSKPWIGTLWDPIGGGRMRKSINNNLIRNLMLRLVDEEVYPKSYDLEAQYKKSLGDENADVENDLKYAKDSMK